MPLDSIGCYPSGVDRDEILRVLRAFEAAGLEYVLITRTRPSSVSVSTSRSVTDAG